MFSEPPPTSLTELRRVLNPAYVTRGKAYAEAGKVTEWAWNAEAAVLQGSVTGSGARRYTTTAEWASSPRGGPRFIGGDCSCPMVADCKHVAALVIAADRQDHGAATTRPATLDTTAPTQHRQRPAEASWQSTIAEWTGRLREPDVEQVPLGIHFSVGESTTGPSSLRVKLVHRSDRGNRGWINQNLDWRTISPWSSPSRFGDYGMSSFDDEHVRVAKAIYALASTRAQFDTYSSSTRSLDLSDIAHPQISDLLRAARSAGMPLVAGRDGARQVHLSPTPAEVRIDITSGPGGAPGRTITPTVWMDGTPREALAFVADPAHGVVLAAPPDDQAVAFVLAPLASRVRRPLAQAARGGVSTQVPAEADEQFLADTHLRLRRAAPLVSSDDSFAPPPVRGPTLVARVRADDDPSEAAIKVVWGYRYQIGDKVREGSVNEPLDDAPWRDPDGELALLDDLAPTLGATGFATPRMFEPTDGLLARPGQLRPVADVTHDEAIALVRDVLPALSEHEGAEVEVIGGPLPDFRDATDSMELEVATRAIPEDRDWFDLDVQLRIDGQKVPLATVFEALAEGRTRLFLTGGVHVSLDAPELVRLQELMAEADMLTERRGGTPRISRYQVEVWEQLAALGIVTEQAEAWRRQAEGLLAGPSEEGLPPPTGLKATLRPYQLAGYAWLSFLAEHQMGGILADDMGLGKTVQTLAMIQQRRALTRDSAQRPPPFLVIAPASVVHGWEEQAADFTPDLDVTVVAATLAKLGTTITEVAADADVVITSYTRFRLDADHYRSGEWAGLIIDEAQAVKNHRSKLYGCVRKLGAPFTIAITGTPMENNLMELWSILSITAPGLFPNPSLFKERFVTPIERHRDAGVLEQLRRRIRPLMLRRTKEQVAADLPPKQEQVLAVELTPAHRKIYDTWLQRERKKILGLMGDLDEHRFTILRSLTMLRLASNHAGLVEESRAAVASAKLDVLTEHLEEVAEGGHRALVFSQFTSFLALVRERLAKAGIDHVYLDGSTRKRQDVVRAFKDGDAPVFVISLKAGGVGLNLTEADYCFLLDPWWNPATEAQAVDRTHRIGQTRKVMVYRMIAAGTIEEKVLALSQRKADLVAGVMDEGPAFDGKLSADDLAALLD